VVTCHVGLAVVTWGGVHVDTLLECLAGGEEGRLVVLLGPLVTLRRRQPPHSGRWSAVPWALVVYLERSRPFPPRGGGNRKDRWTDIQTNRALGAREVLVYLDF